MLRYRGGTEGDQRLTRGGVCQVSMVEGAERTKGLKVNANCYGLIYSPKSMCWKLNHIVTVLRVGPLRGD